MLGVIEAAAGGLEMGLRVRCFGGESVIEKSIQAGQAGTGRQEEQEEE